MKIIFKNSKVQDGHEYIQSIVAVNENRDERRELEKIKKMIDVYLETVEVERQ